MDEKAKLIIKTFGENRVKINEPLLDHTFLQTKGRAKLFFIAFTVRELIRIIETCLQLKVHFLILGTGSKVAISDKGFEGMIIKNRTGNVSVVGVKGKVVRSGLGVREALVEADSGVSVKKLAQFIKDQGLECVEIEKIPGTIGGNLFFNKSLQEKLKSAKVLNRDGLEYKLQARDLNFNRHIILSGIFSFKAKAS